MFIVFFKQKTAYEMRISDWSSDVCSSDLIGQEVHLDLDQPVALAHFAAPALDVEAEAPRFVAARAAFGQAGEPVTDLGEGAGVGGGVGTRGDRKSVV